MLAASGPLTERQMTDTAFSEPSPHVPPNFTYSHAGQSRFRRSLIRAVERLSGRPRLHQMYCDWQASDQRAEESVFAAALRLLDVRLQIEGEGHLHRIPANGGLLIVANHPFGILDGLTIGQLGMRLRGNAQILTNSQLCQVPEIAPHLLPVDFSGTLEARRLTSATRRRAAELLPRAKSSPSSRPEGWQQRTNPSRAAPLMPNGTPLSGGWPRCLASPPCRCISLARTHACSRLPVTCPIRCVWP